MERIYDKIIKEHFKEYQQMAFVSGPRQVGKTTSAKKMTDHYLSWDVQSHRQMIMKGPDKVAEFLQLDSLQEQRPGIVIDELHKYRDWKQFLKGFYDLYGKKCHLLVTGSARLNIYKRGGDSLMGRYFIYRMHPFSIAEISKNRIDPLLSQPMKVSRDVLQTLLNFGGFPEPFLKSDTRFYNRWRRLRIEQLFHEDIRDLTRVQESGQIQALAELVSHQAGQLLNYSSMALKLNVSVDTVRRWMAVLESFYYSFTIRPWFANVAKSLKKQPKVYLWDWSMLKEPAARFENFVASSLLKAVHFWTDGGYGDFSLHFIRDKEKREVDFVVTRDQKPWFLVEAKLGKRALSPHLYYFQQQIGAEHAFQVTQELNFVDRDCFSESKPIIVPALTFMSQLV